MNELKKYFVCSLILLLLSQSANAQVVSTLAGSAYLTGSIDSTGSNARFNSPHGIACDKLGNIYVADRFNHKIRKVTTAGVVTTLAGSGNVVQEVQLLSTNHGQLLAIPWEIFT
jgi:hypothetical protein